MFSLPTNRSVRRWWSRIGVLCAGLLLTTAASAQHEPSTSQEAGQLFTEHFGPYDYDAHAQNWAIVQDARGITYVGNGEGVLEYDGASWRLIETPGQAAVRALEVGPEGAIYVGTRGDFGYLAPDSVGLLHYASLRPRLAEDDRDFADIWRIVRVGEDLFFSARERLFRLAPDGEITSWTPETIFALGFAFDGAFHTVVPSQGLMRVEGDTLALAPGGEAFQRTYVYAALPLDGGAALLVTPEGLQRYDGTSATPFRTEVDEELHHNLLYHGAVLPNGTLALATRQGGLYVIDRQGQLLRRLDEDDGLRDAQLWYVYVGAEGHLWLALNSGVAHVEMTAPLSFFDRATGLRRGVLDVARHDGTLYAATSSGLARMVTTPGRSARFEPVDAEQAGQCLALLSTEAGLLAGCEGGIYVADGDVARLLDGRTTRLFYRSRIDDARVYAASREGFTYLTLQGGTWRVGGILDDLPPWALSMHQDPDGTLWATTMADGIYRAAATSDGVRQVVRYDTTDGLPDGWAAVQPVAGDLVFHTLSGLYRFDGTGFVPDTLLGPLLPEPEDEVFLLEEDAQGNVWFTNADRVGVAWRRDGGYEVEMDALHRLTRRFLYTLYTEDDVAWIGAGEGLYRFDADDDASTHLVPSTYLRGVTTTRSDSLLYGGAGTPPAEVRLAPSDNALRFAYVLPTYDAETDPQYQVRLDGLDTGWSAWSAATSQDYSHLPAGAYTFRVHGRDAYGRVGAEDTFTFRVLPAWHETLWARLFFGLGLVGFVGALSYGGLRYRTRRLEARNEHLERVVDRRTEALVHTNERLRYVLDQNNEFMSIAAHDLRNPISSIIGFADVLLEETDDGLTREHLGIIRESALRMNGVLEQLMDPEALESGRIHLRLERVDLAPLACAALARHRVQADAKHIRLHLDHDGPVHAVCDVQYLPRVLDNLLSNAIKFSEPGTDVHLRLRQEEGRAAVEVADQGPGLTDDDQQHVFGKGARLSARPTAGEASSGLGLYIVRTLVELHGGKVEVDSTPGTGATFRFWLPSSDTSPSSS